MNWGLALAAAGTGGLAGVLTALVLIAIIEFWPW